MTKLDEKDIIG